MAKRKKKRKTKKQKQLEKQLYQKFFVCLFVTGLILVTGKYIFLHKSSIPIDENISSNISFRNTESTDSIKINDLGIMSDKKGKSFLNHKKVEFEISGSEELEYQVIIYPLTYSVPLESIKYDFKIGKKETAGTLVEKELTEDGGYVIFQNKNAKTQNCVLKMWIDENQKETGDNAFEIKIK